MSDVEITVHGRPAHIATIKNTFLGFEDHGIFTATLMVDYDGFTQGVGGMMLSHRPAAGQDHVFSPGIGAYLNGMMEAAGVRQWEHLPGKKILLLMANRHDVAGVCALDGKHLFIFAEWSALVQVVAKRAAALREVIANGEDMNAEYEAAISKQPGAS